MAGFVTSLRVRAQRLRSAPSPSTSSGGHVTPGALSEHVKWTVTGALYQPFAFGDVVAEPMMVGGVLSTTVTSCSAVAVLCAGSIAAYVTVVVPTANALPAGTPERETPAPGQLSEKLAQPRTASLTPTTSVVAPGPVATVTGPGAPTVGGVSSDTVTSCVAVATLPELSVAVNVTVVVPTGNPPPAGTPVRVMPPEGPPSVATAVPSCASETTVPHAVAPGPVAAAMSLGTLVKTGATVSMTSRTTDGSWSLAWTANSAFTWTTSNSSGVWSRTWPLTRM